MSSRICKEEEEERRRNVLVVLMKRPIEGKCKTRLAKSGLGEKRALEFANASIEDTLERFGTLKDVEKILYYAPVEAREYFLGICSNMFEDNRWRLVPMPKGDLADSGLTGILSHGLARAREVAGEKASVAFCGMDSPLLTCDAVIESFRFVNTKNEAYICPANDGGYVLLSVPSAAPSARIFANVIWSSTKTCESQVSQLKASGLSVRVGPTFIDVDEKADLVAIDREASRGAGALRLLSPRVAKLLTGLRDSGLVAQRTGAT